MHNYIPFLLKTSKGSRNFIRSMTLYVSMLFCPLYDKPLTNTNSTSESDSEDENRIRDDEKCCVCKLFTPKEIGTTFPFFSKHQRVPETSLGQ
jgi:hypothetical protein